MYRCFVEYRVADEQRDAYLQQMASLKKRYSNLYLYEGTDQPGLFVEIWETETEEAAYRIRDMRLAQQSPWDELPGMASGKVNAWVFRPV